MSQINFLPESYLREKRRQNRVMRESMLIAVVALLIIVWYAGTQTRVVSLENLVQAKQQEVQSIASQQTEMAKLDQERSVLMQQLQLERELSQPINHTAVVATLAHIMPRSMALTDMSIQMPAPVPSPRIKVSDKSKTSGRNDNRSVAKAPAGPPPVMRVSVVGLASRDMEIADFVGRLTDHALFGNVKMVFSRSVELKDKMVMAREFRVEMDIRLDRIYEAPKGMDQGGMANVN